MQRSHNVTLFTTVQPLLTCVEKPRTPTLSDIEWLVLVLMWTPPQTSETPGAVPLTRPG